MLTYITIGTDVKYVVVAILGGGLLLLASRIVRDAGRLTLQSQPSPTPMNDSSTQQDNSQQNDDVQTTNAQQSVEATTEQSGENNPLKRFQDLANSPTTPDGHKVVAAVAAASTVTVAAVANWLMKATKK